MQVSVTVRGLKEARRALKRAGPEGTRILDLSIQESSAVFRDFIKRMRPVSAATTGYGVHGIPKDKGYLAQQVQKRRIQNLAAGVYGGAEYDPFIQLGTYKMPARPYMQWALDEGGRRLIDATIQKAVDKVAAILLS
jgi:hypothetical protein